MGGALLGVLVWFCPAGLADCKTQYAQAVSLLENSTQQAASNQHPDPDAFSASFKGVVSQMQADQCMPELMSLIQRVQGEQQKYPTPGADKTKPAPILD